MEARILKDSLNGKYAADKIPVSALPWELKRDMRLVACLSAAGGRQQLSSSSGSRLIFVLQKTRVI